MLRNSMLIVLTTLLASCSALWSIANRGALRSGMVEVLAAADVAPEDLTCEMVDSTRTGFCLLAASPAQVSAISSSLGLDRRTADPEDPLTIPPVVGEGRAGCLAPEVFDQLRGMPAYWIGGRPEHLRLSDGGQFEYLLLLYDAASGRACIQVSYAYG